MKPSHVAITLTGLVFAGGMTYYVRRGELGLAFTFALFHSSLVWVFLKSALNRIAWPQYGRGQASVVLRLMLIIQVPLIVCTVLARVCYVILGWPHPLVLLIGTGLGWMMLTHWLLVLLFPAADWRPLDPPAPLRTFVPREP